MEEDKAMMTYRARMERGFDKLSSEQQASCLMEMSDVVNTGAELKAYFKKERIDTQKSKTDQTEPTEPTG